MPRGNLASIRVRLYAAFSLVALLIAGISIVTIKWQLDEAERAALIEAEHVAHSIAITAVDDPMNDPVFLQRYVDALHKFFERDVFIVDVNKRVVADADPREIGTIFSGDPDNPVGKTISDGLTRTFSEERPSLPSAKQLVVPFRSNPTDARTPIVGAVVFEYTKLHDELRADALRFAYLIAALGSAFFALAAFLGLRVASSISRPLTDLERGVRKLAAGDFDAKVEETGNDELTGVAIAFNQMADELRSSRAKLLEHQSELEERVASRTSELRQNEAGLLRAQLMAQLAHVVTGPDGAFESWSSTLPRLIGIEPDRMPKSTREWLALLPPEDRESFRAKSIDAAVKGSRVQVEYRLRRHGEWIHLRQVIERLDETAAPRHRERWFSTIQDVTQRKAAEEKIGRLNRVYAVLSRINTLIVRVRDRDELFRESCRIAIEAGKFRLAWIGIVEQDNARLRSAAWYGDEHHFLAEAGFQLSLRGDGGQHAMVVRTALANRPTISNDVANDSQVRFKLRHAERGINSIAAFPLTISDKVVGVLALHAAEVGFFDDEELRLLNELAGDVSFALEHIEKTEKLDYLAYYDELTGLANRRLFQERVTQHLLAASDGGQRKLAVFALNVDRFKSINDALGRQAGDQLLRDIAERLVRYGGDPNRLTRSGADQFSIVVSDIRSEDDAAHRAAKKLEDCFGAPFEVGSQELRISAKVGIAIFPNDGADAETLMRNAEAALRKAKAGGDSYLFYEQRMTERTGEKLSLENKLRLALENDEFVLHYQPKIELEKRQIVGVEALIRWQSPELGLVPPGRFIPLLEETGLILPVGTWALKRASLDHRGWVEKKLNVPRVAVNVSPIQLRQRDFVAVVEQAIIDGMAPTGIDLEITESLVMEDIQANIEKLKSVRELGIKIAIDDFGTGYSSLAYLAKLPVDTLKIDRSFVITMLQDPDTMSMVQTIISMAHSLRLKVVAEGVDDEEQAKMLRLIRCDEMQGYLFSKPVPSDTLVSLLQKSA